MDLKKAQEYIKALKNGEKFPKKNMFLIMFLLGALLFVIVLPTGSSAPTSEKGGLDENKRKENKNSQTGEYETYIEEKTSSVLSQVKGAGKVTVMVTLKSNGQKLIEKDHSGSTQTQEETSDGNVRKDSESTSEKISVYEQTADGASVPYVSKELINYIDSQYRTYNNRKGRAITGFSMGGHGALWLAFRHPDTYGACGSISGGVDIRPFPENWEMKQLLGPYSENPQRWNEYTVINQLPYNSKSGPLAIIIDCGYYDFFYTVNQKLHEKLRYYNIPHDFLTRPGGHTHEYWNNAIDYQLLFFYKYFHPN